LFNLALAYYYDNDVEEAEQVLMEAFHNTGEIYSQSTNANSDILYVLSMIYAKQLSLCYF